jgi:hypothetical protein
MNKTKMNYWIDLVIAVAFLFSAVSGIVFLFPMSSSTSLGVTYKVWDQIHTWGSLLMIGGVFAHLVLHWKWIVAMTKKTFFPSAKPIRTASTANGNLISRRHFLRTAGLSAVVLGTAAIRYKSLLGSNGSDDQTGTNDITAQPTAVSPTATSIPLVVVPTESTTTQMTVACHKGITYDPYPGKCHHYVDNDGDSYCDYSIPT